MTLAVLGLDAADHRLLRAWGCDNLLLERAGELEPFAHSRDTPLTAEVWPTIATGRMPDEAEGGGRRGSDWSGGMGLADRVARKVLPRGWRSRLGRYLRLGRPGDAMFGPVEDDHVFADGAVFNWPGLTPTWTWKRAEHWLEEFHDGAIDDRAFLRRELAFTGQEMGWLAGMSRTELPIVGVHVHILDHAGHAWATQPAKLRDCYRHVDDLAGTLLDDDAITELVICSDHGMQTTVTDDPDPGHHSWHGVVAATFDGELPSHVSEMRDWLEAHVPAADPVADHWRTGGFDTTREHLEDLGYLD